MRVDALYRGRIALGGGQPARPSTLAALHGRVVATGADADDLDAAVKEDFGGGVVLPGFYDAHCHTTAFGLGLDELDLSTPPIGSLEELYAAVRARSAATPLGEWVLGGGYDQNKLGGSHPDRRRLDEASAGRAVWLRHTSGHMCVVNTAALEQIGPDARRPVDGGLVVLDADGEPTGLLQERAQGLVQRLVLPRSLDALAAAIGRAHEQYLTEGITSVCDAGIAGGWIGQSPVELAAYQRARDTGQLRVRTTAMISSDLLHPVAASAADGIAAALDAGLRSGIGDDWLRVGPLKVFSDGSLIGRTCWMQAGFDDEPANTGYPQAEPHELRAMIVAAHRAGWQVATHAIGDKAVDFTLDCYEEALAQAPRRDHRHRIEHCGITTAVALGRLRSLGVVPVPQGRFVGEIGDGMLAALGPERARLAYRLKSFLEAGIVLPGSSDRPVVEGRPLAGIGDMVLRRTESGAPFAPDEALSPAEAVTAYTLGSAYADRTDAERGTLEVGKLADFVVLGADPREVMPEEISSIPVWATAVGGRVAHRAR